MTRDDSAYSDGGLFAWYPFPALLLQEGRIRGMNGPARQALGQSWVGRTLAELVGEESNIQTLHPGGRSQLTLPVVKSGGVAYQANAMRIDERIYALFAPQDTDSRLFPVDFMLNLDQELRTQLTFVLSSLRTVTQAVEGVSDAKVMRALSNLRQTAFRLLRMSSNVRDVARFVRGEDQMTPHDFDLAALCREVCEVVGAAVPDNPVRFRCSEERLVINADMDLMERLLYNLLSNAIRHSPEGGEIRMELRPEGERVLLQVIDRGPGIDPEISVSLFERWNVIREMESSDSDGISMGLPLCKHIVENHEGTMLFTSGDWGTTVSVSLPHSVVGDTTLYERGADYAGEFRRDMVELSCLPFGLPIFAQSKEVKQSIIDN